MKMTPALAYAGVKAALDVWEETGENSDFIPTLHRWIETIDNEDRKTCYLAISYCATMS